MYENAQWYVPVEVGDVGFFPLSCFFGVCLYANVVNRELNISSETNKKEI